MARQPRIEPSGDVVARVAATALALPDAYEEDAWTGVRWRVRNKTFAHVLVAQKGYTSAYRDLTGVTDPTTVLTFRSSGDALLALTHAGPPFYQPPCSPTAAGAAVAAALRARRRRAAGSAPRRPTVLPAAMVAHRRRHGARRPHRLGRGGRSDHRKLPVLRTPEAEAPAIGDDCGQLSRNRDEKSCVMV